jgi:hypothetical protein
MPWLIAQVSTVSKEGTGSRERETAGVGTGCAGTVKVPTISLSLLSYLFISLYLISLVEGPLDRDGARGC